MSIKLIDTVKPKGDFPIAEASDILMPDGKRLSNALPVPLTQEEYDALMESDNIDNTTIYVIYNPNKGIEKGNGDDG